MARRKKNQFKIPIEAVRNIIIGIFIIFIVLVIGKHSYQYIMQAPLFSIKSVKLAPSLQFIQSSALKGLIHQNIFNVDLRSVEKKVRQDYPQISELKIERRFPDQVLVTAKKREPVVQMYLNKKYYVLDEERVPILQANVVQPNLPLLSQIGSEKRSIVMGSPLHWREIKAGLSIIEAIAQHPYLARYKVKQIDLGNLSKITVQMQDYFNLIVDRDQIAKKIEMLGILIAQHQLDPKVVHYVDLRFKEPIVGKK